MKIIVIGAGVVGTTTAWYLTEEGHEVEILERREAAGMETSFANGGQISPCHTDPWASPTVLPKILRWLGREDAPLLMRWQRWDPELWAWGLRFLANCTPGRAKLNTERALRLAMFSRQCLRDLRQQTGLAYDQRTAGILHIYRDADEFAHACATAGMMLDHGLERLMKTPAECVAVEPALANVAPELAGGIYTPGDESGDAHLFTQALADLAAARGARFRWNVAVQGLVRDGNRIDGIVTDSGTVRADAYVLATGCVSPALVRPLGLRLPIIPAKGYSLTVPVDHHLGAPVVSITDDEHKIVYSRLGDRLRIAGTAEMTGFDLTLTPSRLESIKTKAQEMFPDGGDYSRAEPWTGLRPTTPDGVPLLGATPFRNLWLNTGHGTLGWTMACGSGRLLADLITGRHPGIDPAGLGMERL
ncbi:D-amino acid dehydrogenase [Magnetospirillum fulvum]|uniref:D-amino acid dehydrogenase n=1 Tax=Magnetospirillum fulvum MGU-K5 TaxID=1316936 RepID=S9THP8_MAGFU|nr:D-amino acid dehydrogenase [Magnetospirillum fulvum]EPY01806.1 glycine/D-amino acid oxidase [Magnetospirillum fulvum MGU-K5]